MEVFLTNSKISFSSIFLPLVDDLVNSTVIEACGCSAYWNNFDPDMYMMGFTAESPGDKLTMRHQPETGAGDGWGAEC